MAYTQPRAIRIGEHVQDLIFGLTGMVLYLIDITFLPVSPPFLLNTFDLFLTVVTHAEFIKAAKISNLMNLLPPFVRWFYHLRAQM